MSANQPIITGEAVALELRPAGVGSRGTALVIDLSVQIVLVLAWGWALTGFGLSADTAAVQAVVLILFVATVLGYPVGFETLWRGRTLGKAAMGLRVVRDDGGPIRFRHALVRGLVGVVVDRPGVSVGLLALIPMLVTNQSKRVGDLAAGTVVVQERVPSRLVTAPKVAPELAGWAAALDLSAVDDTLALQIRQFLARAGQLSPRVRDEMGNQLLGRIGDVVGPLPAGMAPWTYLHTVIAERSRREVARLSGDGRAAPQSTPAPPPAGPFAPPG